jgi:hypothetical protein
MESNAITPNNGSEIFFDRLIKLIPKKTFADKIFRKNQVLYLHEEKLYVVNRKRKTAELIAKGVKYENKKLVQSNNELLRNVSLDSNNFLRVNDKTFKKIKKLIHTIRLIEAMYVRFISNYNRRIEEQFYSEIRNALLSSGFVRDGRRMVTMLEEVETQKINNYRLIQDRQTNKTILGETPTCSLDTKLADLPPSEKRKFEECHAKRKNNLKPLLTEDELQELKMRTERLEASRETR